MSNKGQLLQDPFLNLLRKEHVPVSIYLVNGIKLQGQIESFDQYVVLLRNTVTQMVYKHAISTVVPGRAGQLPRGGTSAPRRRLKQPPGAAPARGPPTIECRPPGRAGARDPASASTSARARFDATLDELALLAESAGDVAVAARRLPTQGARSRAVRRLGQGRRDQGARARHTAPRR